jgi:hypothetical protein
MVALCEERRGDNRRRRRDAAALGFPRQRVDRLRR